MSARLRSIALALLLCAGMAPMAQAIEADEILSNPKLEARARAIDRQLRCVVCQDESIDVSNAPLAHDLRLLVRAHLLRGDSNEQIKHYIVARYGNFVLLKPPLIGETLPLWLGPLLLLTAGAGGIIFWFRRRRSVESGIEPLSPEEYRLHAALFAPDDETERP